MANLSYWEKRAAEKMFEQMEDAEKFADEITKHYLQASRYLIAKSEGIFRKYAGKHMISRKDAEMLLSEIKDPAKIMDIVNRLDGIRNGEGAKALLESEAYRYRINRYYDMQKQIDDVVHRLYNIETINSDRFYRSFTTEAYYRSMFDITQRIGFAIAFDYISEKDVDKVVKSKFYGHNYSENIWKNTDAVARKVKEEVFLCLITGKTEFEAAKQIEKQFGSAAYAARRLIRTESAYLSGQMDTEAMKQAQIEFYRFTAVLDLRTSAICRSMDGKIFKVSEQQIGKNAPPMHPNCRSTKMSIISKKYLDKMKRKFRNPETGEYEKIPINMTYKDWYKKYVQGKEIEELDKVWKNGVIPEDK